MRVALPPLPFSAYPELHEYIDEDPVVPVAGETEPLAGAVSVVHGFAAQVGAAVVQFPSAPQTRMAVPLRV